MNSRNILLDVLKGFAIIAVILYHAGVLSSGYLGVEVFLVISGYLTTKSLFYSYEKMVILLFYLNVWRVFGQCCF